MRDAQLICQELLVLRAQDGDRAALDELIRLSERKLLYYIRRLVGNEADAWQILQDVLVKLTTNIHGLRAPEKFTSWTFSIARLTVMSHHRDVWKEIKTADLTAAPEPAIESNEEITESADEVHYGLSKLSLVDREVLTLHFLQELSTEDIAAVLRIPRGTVKSRLYHARQRLHQVLSQLRGRHD